MKIRDYTTPEGKRIGLVMPTREEERSLFVPWDGFKEVAPNDVFMSDRSWYRGPYENLPDRLKQLSTSLNDESFYREVPEIELLQTDLPARLFY